MKTLNILKGVAAVALLTSFGAAANAAHLPSPCATGEVGEGTNCMYIVGGQGTNSYNNVDGNRTNSVGLGTTSIDLDIWIDFGTLAVQGGGFDIGLTGTAAASVTTMTWAWGPDFTAGEQSLSGNQNGTVYEGIQFDDFAGNGFGGSTGTQPGFSLVGTLTVSLSAALTQADTLLASIAQPYTDATFPNCFAPGAASGAPAECVATNFYTLDVQAVPLPAAVWMMLAGLGSLVGFARRRS